MPAFTETNAGIEFALKHFLVISYSMVDSNSMRRIYTHNLLVICYSFPRIPLAKNFGEYKELGEKLSLLHVSYEKVEPYPLKRIDSGKPPTEIKLAIKNSKIVIDDATVLEDLPIEATQYMIGTKPALGWVLEFYKESKHTLKVGNNDKYDTRDQAVADRFNTYRFVDHKDDAIDLLRRVTTVSVETMRLKQQLEALEWGPQPKLKFTLPRGKNNPVRSKKHDRKQPSKNQTLGVKNEP